MSDFKPFENTPVGNNGLPKLLHGPVGGQEWYEAAYWIGGENTDNPRVMHLPLKKQIGLYGVNKETQEPSPIYGPPTWRRLQTREELDRALELVRARADERRKKIALESTDKQRIQAEAIAKAMAETIGQHLARLEHSPREEQRLARKTA